MKIKSLICALALSAMAAKNQSSAQVILSGTNYSQRFDLLSLGLPAGWSVRTNATAGALGIPASFTTNNIAWTSTAGQFANYASTVNNGTNFVGGEGTAIQSACTNRCPGLRQTGSFGDPGAAFVLQLQNTLGFASFQLSVDLNLLNEQLPRTNSWIIDYGIGVNPGAFIPVWTNADPGVFGSMTRVVSFGGALDNQSQNVWIRVVAREASAGSGNRDVFGIDNFQLNYQANGAIPAIPLQIELADTNVVLTWTNASFTLQAASAPNGIYTNVPGAVSPYSNPIISPQKYFRLKAD